VRAARWHARWDIRIDDVPQPEPAADEVLIRVMFCGICGTDLEEYREGPLTVPVGMPHQTSGRSAPLTLGHEVVGIVERAAADGSGPAVGHVVLPDAVLGCGHCWWCRRHEEGQCVRLSIRGQTDDGGLADYMCARAATCIVVPDGLDAALAALAEPAAVAIRAIRKLNTPLGARIGVMGGGTIGQLVAQVARASGASFTVLVDPLADRRAMAEKLAGAQTCNPADVAALVADLPEPGLDAVIECTGRPGVLAQSVALVRTGGTVVALGLRPGEEAISLVDLVIGEKRIIGSAAHLWDTDVADAVTMMGDGRLNVGPLITHRVGLDDLVDVGLALLSTPDSGALKVLVDCK
jgi:(R,R)-butanediol dehydrogenase / meso-butanediol dehydrogenase / diacetyl reductase